MKFDSAVKDEGISPPSKGNAPEPSATDTAGGWKFLFKDRLTECLQCLAERITHLGTCKLTCFLQQVFRLVEYASKRCEEEVLHLPN